MNSVACRGLSGVSDSPVSAMWAADIIAAATNAGVSSTNFHISSSVYDPLYVNNVGNLVAHPLWNGMRFAQKHLQPGARFVLLNGGVPQGLTAWATRLNGEVRIMIANHTATAKGLSLDIGTQSSQVSQFTLDANNSDPTGAVDSEDTVSANHGIVTSAVPGYGVISLHTR